MGLTSLYHPITALELQELTGLDAMSDVNVQSPEQAQALFFDGDTETWVNRPIVGTDLPDAAIATQAELDAEAAARIAADTLRALDAAVVHLAGAETLTGAKTFNANAYFKNGNPWADCVAWGADPTGAADSTTAIQAAIDSLIATGGVAWLPPGTYKINTGTSQLTPRSNIQIIGAGPGSTILKVASGSTATCMMQEAAGYSNVTIAGITFDQNGQNVQGLRIVRAASFNIRIERCNFINPPASANYPQLSMSAARKVVVKGCTFAGATTAGRALLTFNDLADVIIEGNTFEACYQAITIDNSTAVCRNITIANNLIRNCGRYGIWLKGAIDCSVIGNVLDTTTYTGSATDASVGVAAHVACERITIVGNTLRSFGEIGVYDSFEVSVTGNTVYGSQAAGIEINDNEATTFTDAHRVRVIGNLVKASGSSGIFVSGRYVKIAFNDVIGCAGSGIKVAEGANKVDVIGNTSMNNGTGVPEGNGIQIANSGDTGVTSDVLVSANTCYDDQGSKSQDYGIAIDNNLTTDVRVVRNDFRGNLTGAARINSTGAIEWDKNLGLSDVAAVTTTHTVLGYQNLVKADATAGAFTVNLPTAVGREGREITVKKVDASANAVTVDGSGAETIDGAATVALATQWEYVTVRSDGTNWIVVAND